ncbi:MAG: NAD-dependent deacylase [Gemmatimonadota bacterium]
MDDLERAVQALDEAGLVVAATGAGMSQESGIPTFRDALEGLWARYDPQELATRDGFRRDPARVWGWYNYRRGLIAAACPNAGHEALAKLEKLVPRVVVVTQNIDGMHRRAGSGVVLELHGSINRFKCFECDHPVDDAEIPLADSDGPLDPPTCKRCGSAIRPDVVWFGEMLPAGVLEEAESLAGSCDVMLVVGTSGLVYPAAALPFAARDGGATVIEVNTERSGITGTADIFLQGPAGEVLPAIVSSLEAGRS